MFVLLIGAITVFLTISVHYLSLKAISIRIMKGKFHPTLRIGITVYLLLIAHCIEILIFSLSFYLAIEYANTGSIEGEFSGQLQEYIYFSFSSYTSLGIGDVYPLGAVRLLTGLEALTGLVMIGWTASFTYFYMDEL